MVGVFLPVEVQSPVCRIDDDDIMFEAYLKEKTLNQLEKQLPEDVAAVRARLEKLSEEEPVSAHALSLLARCELIEGRLGQAGQVLEQLLSLQPDHLEARVELAKIRHEEGDVDTAVKLMNEATQSRPEVIENWLLLKSFLEKQDQQKEAENARAQYEMIKAFNDNLAMAEKAYLNAEYVRADNLCRQLLQRVPGEVRAMRLLAKLARHFRHFEISKSILEPCIRTRPWDPGLGLEYAYSLLACREFQSVLEECDRLIGIAPERADIYNVKAEALYNLARYDEAIDIYRGLAAVRTHPELPLLYLGKALKTVGEGEQAIDCFQRSIKSSPGLGQAYWELASLKTYRFSDDEINAMQAQLEGKGISPINRVLLQFALGKGLEDAGRFEESFSQYQSANHAYTQIRPYRYISQNTKHEQFFTSQYFAGRKGGGNESDAPIFVVGLPRSGSTLVEQILTSHSRVDATRELTAMTSISRELNGSSLPGKGQYPQSLGKLTADQLESLAQRYLDEVQTYRQDAPFFVDKAPANFHHIGLIKTLFPRAKIIDIRRHPMASGWSLYRHFFADSFLFSYDLKTIGKYYNDYIELMDHWHAVLPGQILTMSYEDLVTDLPGNVEKILVYCGLEMEEACVNFHQNPRAVATPSSEQVRQPIYDHALDHWRNYEKHLSPLKQLLKN
jgi:predicted Zn-dependent protease